MERDQPKQRSDIEIDGTKPLRIRYQAVEVFVPKQLNLIWQFGVCIAASLSKHAVLTLVTCTHRH